MLGIRRLSLRFKIRFFSAAAAAAAELNYLHRWRRLPFKTLDQIAGTVRINNQKKDFHRLGREPDWKFYV